MGIEGDAMAKDFAETESKCIWSDLFDEKQKSSLLNGLIFSGLLSAVLISWLNCQNLKLLLGNLKNMQSYYILFTFITATQLRTFLMLFSRFEFVKRIIEIWFVRCDFLGFTETFLAVLEVETLTHMCIERYVVAKYITNGWQTVNQHYTMYFHLSCLFSVLYSAPPLYGLGRYGYDFGCISYTYDMVLPGTWQRYLSSIIFFMRSYKPAAFMVIMLFWARRFERNFDNAMKNRADLHFTQCVITLALVNLACWTPLALIRTWVVMSQLLYNELYIPSSLGIRWAMWVHEITPVFTTMSILCHRRHEPHKPVSISNDGEDKEHTLKED